jgi:hypothetical protein
MSTRTNRQRPSRGAPAERAYGGYGGGQQWADEPDRGASVYWRRRFIALMIGLAVLAVVAWALNGAIARPAPAANSSNTNNANTVNSGVALQPSISTTPSSAASQGSVSPAAGTHRTGAASHSPTPGTSPSSHATKVHHHGPSPCASADVVLSLFSAQASYSARQTPEFSIDVVSTANQTCTFNIGSRHLLLQVTQGSKKVWTSADCAEGQASLVTRLRRGVPTTVPVTWTGRRSAPGCPVPGTAAKAGTYTATAADGQLSSNPIQFRLG